MKFKNICIAGYYLTCIIKATEDDITLINDNTLTVIIDGNKYLSKPNPTFNKRIHYNGINTIYSLNIFKGEDGNYQKIKEIQDGGIVVVPEKFIDMSENDITNVCRPITNANTSYTLFAEKMYQNYIYIYSGKNHIGHAEFRSNFEDVNKLTPESFISFLKKNFGDDCFSQDDYDNFFYDKKFKEIGDEWFFIKKIVAEVSLLETKDIYDYNSGNLTKEHIAKIIECFKNGYKLIIELDCTHEYSVEDLILNNDLSKICKVDKSKKNIIENTLKNLKDYKDNVTYIQNLLTEKFKDSKISVDKIKITPGSIFGKLWLKVNEIGTDENLKKILIKFKSKLNFDCIEGLKIEQSKKGDKDIEFGIKDSILGIINTDTTLKDLKTVISTNLKDNKNSNIVGKYDILINDSNVSDETKIKDGDKITIKFKDVVDGYCTKINTDDENNDQDNKNKNQDDENKEQDDKNNDELNNNNNTKSDITQKDITGNKNKYKPCSKR